MSSIRNLSGAPSFGGSSNHQPPRRRARSHTADSEISSSLMSRTFSQSLTDATRPRGRSSLFHSNNSISQHHISGEVIGPSLTNHHNQHHQSIGSQSFAYRPRYNVSNSYNIRDNSIVPPPPPSSSPKPPSPSSSPSGGGGGFRKRLRAATWDSTSRLSPVNMLSKSGSFQDRIPTNSSAGGGGESVPNSSNAGKIEQFIYDSDRIPAVDVSYSTDSDDDDSNNLNDKEEMKCEEAGDQDINELELSLHSLREEELGESDTSLSPIKQQRQRKNAITKKNKVGEDASSTVNSEEIRVTFADDVANHSGEEDEDEDEVQGSRTRPSCFIAKLPALQTWGNDEDDEDETSSYMGSPTSMASASPNRYHDSKAFSHFKRTQSSERGVFHKMNPFKNMSWSLIGSCIVRTAPCFWCSMKLGISATDREVLLRLNLLCAFFCVVQICAGVFLFVVGFIGYKAEEEEVNNGATMETEDNEDKPLVSAELWSIELFVYCLSVVSIVLLVASLLAQRAIREVNLVGSVRYMWCLFWVTPIQIFFMIGLFDYYSVNEVTVKHWWDDPSFSTAREFFCPPGTADAECAVPVQGGAEYETEEKWCMNQYNVSFNNSTYCQDIRDESQDEYNVASRIFYTANAIWALVLVLLIWVTLCVLQGIITLPIVQRSKESNIPLWLTFPIVGCYSIGYLLIYSESSFEQSVQDVYWIGLAYFVSGGAFTLAALVGIFLKCYTVLNGRQRRIKQGVVVLFIVIIFITVFAVATIFTTSLIYSLNIVDFQLDSYREIACYLDSDGGSCTGCNPRASIEEDVCPEWSEDDVKSVAQTIMKQSSALAAIFLVYALVTLRYGFVLFRHVSRYQIEYV